MSIPARPPTESDIQVDVPARDREPGIGSDVEPVDPDDAQVGIIPGEIPARPGVGDPRFPGSQPDLA